MAVCRTEFQTFFELYDDIRLQYVTCYNQIYHKTLTISEDTELTLNSTKFVTSVAPALFYLSTSQITIRPSAYFTLFLCSQYRSYNNIR